MRRSHDTRVRLPSPLVRCLCALSASAVLAGGPASVAKAAPAGDAISREYDIKAAFLYNFTKFIEWPPQSFGDATAPIVIGVLGDSPCKAALERIVKDRKIHGRAIAVRKVDTPQELTATHLLFVGAGHEGRFEQLQAAIATLPVVTVGESRAFAASGGAINFVLEGDNIRFEINMKSAGHVSVKISAQLMKLATTVRRG